MTVPRSYAVVLPAYLAGLLALDTQVSFHGQLALGALTFAVLAVALRPLAPLVRAQAVGVVLFATVGEVTGSLVWGVYHYRLHNLPLFIPPAHGLVYLSGIALSRSLRARAVVWAAAVGAAAWGIAGLTVLPRLDVAGAVGVPLLLVFLWRSRSRATYAGVFLVVAALELYGTSIGTWRWASTLPGLGIPDGNPPSGVASGYVWFDVMALLVAPWLVYFGAGTLKPKLSALSGAVRELDPAQGADRDDERVGRVVRARPSRRASPSRSRARARSARGRNATGRQARPRRPASPRRWPRQTRRSPCAAARRTPRAATRRWASTGPARRDPSIASDPDEPLDDLRKRLRRVDLVRARRAKQRFDLAEMREDQLTLLERLPVVVGGAARDPVEEDVRRRD